MNNQEAEELLNKYLSGHCTPQEKILFESLYNKMLENQPGLTNEPEYELIKDTIYKRLPLPGQKTFIKRLYPYIAAASVLLVLSFSGYFLLRKPSSQLTAQNNPTDINPGSAHAILKTGGRTIRLDNTGKGLIAKQGNTIINKTADGQVAYQNTALSGNEQIPTVYDTLQIPAGAKPYQVKLADGSKILLNAATSLRFPENFNAKKRADLELISGEAYCEIIHNEKAPLHIKTAYGDVEDIGTKFNISAYPDDPDSRTTLVEGAIRINQVSLAPGQQAIATGKNGPLQIKAVNTALIIAWTQGLFRFRREPLGSIMRKVSRWYNVEIVYKDQIQSLPFTGTISRYSKVSEVLTMMELTGLVHFKIEGKKIIVSK